jgi:hypothetical protein
VRVRIYLYGFALNAEQRNGPVVVEVARRLRHRGRRYARQRAGYGGTRKPGHHKVYDRTGDEITLGELKRISI